MTPGPGMMGQTCGEWINSHVLHIYLLHAPDFLGDPDIIGMACDHAQDVERGLSLKKAGNQLMEFVGVRAIHPINVRLGGFYSLPTRLEFRPIAEQLRRALDNALATVEWVSGFEFPDHELDHEFLALTALDWYPIENGTIARSAGWCSADGEIGAALPGDDWFAATSARTTRAITIDAPVEMIWPWLVQMGEDRGGFTVTRCWSEL